MKIAYSKLADNTTWDIFSVLIESYLVALHVKSHDSVVTNTEAGFQIDYQCAELLLIFFLNFFERI